MLTELLLLAAAQDLFEREAELRRRLPPVLDLSGVRKPRAVVELDVKPDIGCGGFDVKASFRSLFDRNVKEEFLDGALKALQSELAGSALVLACYASPTVCDTIKHYRLSANAMLGMELDGCRALERSLGDAGRQTQARAVKECLDRKAAEGVPLDRARKACEGSEGLRGLDGRRVDAIDLVKDLGLPDGLVSGVRIGPGAVRSDAQGAAVAETFERKRQAAVEAWRTALERPGAAPPGPVSQTELRELAAMDPARRDAAVASVASAQALAETVREAQEAERAIETGELGASPEVREELERRRRQLRNEISRLAERFEAERRVQAAVEAARAAAAADAAEKARARLAGRRSEEAQARAAERAKPWGCETKKGARDGPQR